MSAGGKIPTDGGKGLGQNPFGALSSAGLPGAGNRNSDTGDRIPDLGNRARETASRDPQAAGPIRNPQSAVRNQKSRGRVDIRRETGGRGGKTVTVVDGFAGIGLPEKEQLAKKMRAACGCGGTVKDGAIEIQGDQRETVARILSEAGFRPVFAGG
jgi:translation initiation factor 1